MPHFFARSRFILAPHAFAAALPATSRDFRLMRRPVPALRPRESDDRFEEAVFFRFRAALGDADFFRRLLVRGERVLDTTDRSVAITAGVC